MWQLHGECTSRAFHLDAHEKRIHTRVTADTYFHDLREASLYDDGATLEKPGLRAQPKLYLADLQDYVTGLANILHPSERQQVIRNWHPVMEDQVLSSGYY